MKNKDNNLRYPSRLNHQFGQVALLIVVWLGLLFAFSTKAASLQLVPNWGATGMAFIAGYEIAAVTIAA